MSAFEINIWGRFSSTRTEFAFLNHNKDAMITQNKYGILVSGIAYLLVAIADYFKVGICSIFYVSTSIRLAFFLYCLAVFIRLGSRISIRKFFWLTFLFVIGNSVVLLSLIYVLNPDKQIDRIDELTLPFITLMLFVLTQAPIIVVSINGLVAIAGYTILLSCLFNTPADFVLNIFALLLVLVLSGFLLNRFIQISRRKNYTHAKHIESLNFFLKREMREKVHAQVALQKTHKDLTDSIEYAKNLQLSFMPTREKTNDILQQHLLIFKPRDVVSGDFYWLGHSNNKTIVAVADSTGHGVPAAFMSILGIALINKITRQMSNDETLSAASILENLRTDLLSTFTQNEQLNNRTEGMDIALCIIDHGAKSMQFAGAYNDLWLFRRNNDIIDFIAIRGNKMPIGLHISPEHFNNHEIALQPQDTIYLFSDGITDQFGGPREKRFMKKNFKKLLMSIQDHSMIEQEQLIQDTFLAWKKNNDQIDDILVLGIRF